MKPFGMLLIVIAVCGLAVALAGIPYCLYIGLKYGWLDDRIGWAPLGMPVSLGSVLIARIGFDIVERAK